MTLTPARIEAAARAMYRRRAALLSSAEMQWDDVPEDMKAKWRGIAEEFLTAAFPDLVSGEAWIAPREATEGMATAAHAWWANGRLDLSLDEAFGILWAEARDAYLAEQSDKDKTT